MRHLPGECESNAKKRRLQFPDTASGEHEHASVLAGHLTELYRQRRFTDFEIVCCGRSFLVHACVIICRSAYFRSLLQSGMLDSVERRVELDTMNPNVIETIVESLYTGVLAIQAGNVMALLAASKRLQVAHAEEQCCQWLLAHLDMSNALTIWDGSNKLECSNVCDKALSIIGRYLEDVARTEAFLSLPQAQLLELICSDSLSVRSEQAVYSAVMRWARWAGDRARLERLHEVLCGVRLPLMGRQCLLNAVSQETLLEACPQARQMMSHAIALLSEAQSQEPRPIFSHKRRAMCSERLLLVGGRSSRGSNGSVESFEPRSAMWTAHRAMLCRRQACGVAAVSGLVFAVGGSNGGCSLRSAECYDPDSGQWSALPDMSAARAGCGATGVDGLLYVVGGKGGGSRPRSAECFDLTTAEWRLLPEMSFGRHKCAVANLNSLVCAVGGWDGRVVHKSVECYDPSTGKWSALPDMTTRRFGCGACVCDGLLYVMGGSDGNRSLKSVECFDPVTSEWRTLPDMRFARQGCGAACVEGQIFVIGGYSHNAYLRSFESYHPGTQEWQVMPPARTERWASGAVAIPGPCA